MLEAVERFLPREDADVDDAVHRILTDEGVQIVTGAQVREVRDGKHEATVVHEVDGVEHILAVDAILPAHARGATASCRS